MTRAALLLAVLSLAACGEGGGKPATDPVAATPAVATTLSARVTDAGQLARGGEIYKANCAVCHGANAEGAPNWQRPGPDGKYPAPPLDGSGHAWHHSGTALKQTIRGGTLKLGGSMPALGGKLSETEIEAVIVWFQLRWPDEIYSAWLNMEMRTNK